MSKPVFATPTSSSKILLPPKSCIRLTSSRTPASCIARRLGGADVWACSKVPFALREQVATAFGASSGKVCRPSLLHRRLLRRQGRFHGCAGGLFSFGEKRPAGQDGDGLLRRSLSPAIRAMRRSFRSKPA